MALLSCLALILWIFGKYFEINATVSALAVLCLMVLFNVITWNDIITNKAAWNVFLWFGALVTLAGGLNNVGFLDWFANKITSGISSYSPAFILIFLLLAFYFTHYLFASSTAHVTALLTLFLVAGRKIPGIKLSSADLSFIIFTWFNGDTYTLCNRSESYLVWIRIYPIQNILDAGSSFRNYIYCSFNISRNTLDKSLVIT